MGKSAFVYNNYLKKVNYGFISTFAVKERKYNDFEKKKIFGGAGWDKYICDGLKLRRNIRATSNYH